METQQRPTTRERTEFILDFTKCMQKAKEIWGEDGMEVMYTAMHHAQPEQYLRERFEAAFEGS